MLPEIHRCFCSFPRPNHGLHVSIYFRLTAYGLNGRFDQIFSSRWARSRHAPQTPPPSLLVTDVRHHTKKTLSCSNSNLWLNWCSVLGIGRICVSSAWLFANVGGLKCKRHRLLYDVGGFRYVGYVFWVPRENRITISTTAANKQLLVATHL